MKQCSSVRWLNQENKGSQAVQLSVANSPSRQNWIWDLPHLQIMYQGFPCKDNVATVCSETLVSIQFSGIDCKELHIDITTCLLGMVLKSIQHFTKKVLSYTYMVSIGLGQSPLLGPCIVVLQLWIQYSRKLLNNCATIKLSTNTLQHMWSTCQ